MSKLEEARAMLTHATPVVGKKSLCRVCDGSYDGDEHASLCPAVGVLTLVDGLERRAEDAEARVAGLEAARETVDIVFDGPPGHVSGRFVEAEVQDGKDVRVGRWVHREDGFWALRLEVFLTPAPAEALRP